MAGGKAKTNNHCHRQQQLMKMIGGNRKAAIMTRLSSSQGSALNAERWTDILQTYSDYFIRY